MPERLKGADCKSVGLRLRWFESNSLHQLFCKNVLKCFKRVSWGCCRLLKLIRCGCSSMVELKPSKLMTRVRFPSPAPALRSILEIRPCGSVVEHSLGKGEVGSSILPMGTTIEVELTRSSFAIDLIKELFKGRQKNGKRKV